MILKVVLGKPNISTGFGRHTSLFNIYSLLMSGNSHER